MSSRTYIVWTLVFALIVILGTRVLDTWVERIYVLEDMAVFNAIGDYESYQKEMVDFNDALRIFIDKTESDRLSMKEIDIPEFNWEVQSAFRNTCFNLSRFNMSKLYPSPYFQEAEILSESKGVFENIMMDGRISEDEKQYLSSLHDYVVERITTFDAVNGLKENAFDHDDIMMNGIIDLYARYLKSGNALIKDNRYAFLMDYEGDFEGADFESAKSKAVEAITWIAADVTLSFDNRDERGQRFFIFRNYPLDDLDVLSRVIDGGNQEYEVQVDKMTGSVQAMTMGYSLDPDKAKLTEKQVDELTQRVVSKIDPSAKVLKRTFEEDPGNSRFYTVTYDYTGDIHLRVLSTGVVTEVRVGK